MKSYQDLREEKIFVNNLNDASYGIYIGRGSILGNPFKIKRDGDRNEVIDKYRSWLWTEIGKHGRVWDELIRIFRIWEQCGHVSLACYCFPKACHGQVIGSALVWMRDVNSVF